MGQLQRTEGSVTPGQAKEVLGLVPMGREMTALDVRHAWNEAVKANHPDTITKDDSARIVYSMAHLTEARDLLLAVLAGSDRACKFCKGTGKVRGRLGAVDCVTCKGTGDKL